MELSPCGHKQAEGLAKFLHELKADAIYASPMKRVQQTLIPLLRNEVPPPTILEGLREVDFGDWTGLTWDEVREKFGVSAFEWIHQLEGGKILNAESGTSYRSRIESCIREIVRDQPEKKTVVLCHGGVIRVMLAIMLDLPLTKTAQFEVEHASVTHLELRDGRVILEYMNYTPWSNMVA